ncbi:hypothetical protein [Pseudolysinimonas sp.]
MREQKKLRKMTVARLRDRLEDVGWTTTVNSLNGMLGVKGRKAVTLHELIAFALALEVTVDELLFPVGSEIELTPGGKVGSADAVARMLAGRVTVAGQEIRVEGRAELVLRIVQLGQEVSRALWLSSKALRDGEGEHFMTTLRYPRLARAVEDLNAAIARYQDEWKEQPPTLEESAAWAIGVTRDEISTPLVLSLEPLLKASDAVG